MSLRSQLPDSLESLRVAVDLDPEYRGRARHDADLANLAADEPLGLEFRVLVGADD